MVSIFRWNGQKSCFRERKKPQHKPITAITSTSKKWLGTTTTSLFSGRKNDDETTEPPSDSSRSGQNQTSAGTSSVTSPLLTSAVLHVSFDGLSYHGWTASNIVSVSATDLIDDDDDDDDFDLPSLVPYYVTASEGRPSHRRRRKLLRKHGIRMDRNARVTTVQSMLEGALYKLYGNNPSVTVEGCSRTGRGVSAVYLIAHMFCPKSKPKRQQSECESEEPIVELALKEKRETTLRRS
jgi:hypothetical protein